jgi:hypothetical protein
MSLGQVQSLVAKRVGIRVRRGRASNIRDVWRAPCYQVPETFSLRARDTNLPIVERYFFASVSFSPSEKEMKCRHAQWLIVIKRTAKT